MKLVCVCVCDYIKTSGFIVEFSCINKHIVQKVTWRSKTKTEKHVKIKSEDIIKGTHSDSFNVQDFIHLVCLCEYKWMMKIGQEKTEKMVAIHHWR